MAGDIAQMLARLQCRPIVVATHPRSGTHLTIDFVRRQFRECRSWKLPGEKLNRLYVSLESVFGPRARGPMSETRAIRVLGRVPRPLIKTHMSWDQLWNGTDPNLPVVSAPWRDWLRANADFYYVYRDGRDVMCSYHLYKKGSEVAARCPIGEFIRRGERGRNHVAVWAEHVRGWLAAGSVPTLRLEDLFNRPREIIDRLTREISLTPLNNEPLLPSRFKGIWDSRLNRLFAIRPQSSAIIGWHKGERLDRWRDAFTPEDRVFFDQEAGDLLIELGYETSRAWVNGLAPSA